MTWVDHTFHPGEWSPEKGDPLTVWTSAGYLLRQDDELVLIAQSIDKGIEPHEVLALIAGCVLSITPLKRKKVPPTNQEISARLG